MEHPLGSKENPFTIETYDKGDPGYKYCRCGQCNEVGKCTPRSDYMKCDDGKLRCASCFTNYLGSRGVKELIEVEPEPDTRN